MVSAVVPPAPRWVRAPLTTTDRKSSAYIELLMAQTA